MKALEGYCQPDTVNCPRKERYDQLGTENRRLKRQLKNCICPNCGYGFKQALKKKGKPSLYPLRTWLKGLLRL